MNIARVFSTRVGVLLTIAGVCGAPLLAQGLETPKAPNLPDEGGYGGGTFVTIIGGSEFQPLAQDVTLGYLINDATRFPATGPNGFAILGASFNGRIPEGAIVTSMCVYGEDTTAIAGANLFVSLARNRVDSATGLNPGLGGFAATASSFSNPGDFIECVNLNARIQSRWDIDNDGTIEIVDHNLVADFGENRDVFGGSIRIRAVRLVWHRVVSPSPGVATFNDVPTSHPYFAFVEALSAAGITGGCGGGNYCVNNPITRGEMAVFLAVALGLHWPAF
jgi:hypothetical protein